MSISNNLNFHPKEELLNSKFIEECNNSFFEIGLSTALTGSACLFAASPAVASSLVVFTITILSINIFSRISAVILDRCKLKPAADICHIIAPFNMSFIYGTTGNVLVHEAGHAAAITLICKNAKPKITIDSLFAGSTSWMNGKYTRLGKLLGPLNSQMLIAAAGPLAAVVLATIGIILALRLGLDSYLGKCALFSSIFSIVHHVDYALSTFNADPTNLGHDFLMLWYCGIHPAVSAICLIAIPTITIVGYVYYNKINNSY